MGVLRGEDLKNYAEESRANEELKWKEIDERDKKITEKIEEALNRLSKIKIR